MENLIINTMSGEQKEKYNYENEPPEEWKIEQAKLHLRMLNKIGVKLLLIEQGIKETSRLLKLNL